MLRRPWAIAKAASVLILIVLFATCGIAKSSADVPNHLQKNAQPSTLNPSLSQLQHTAWTDREGAPQEIRAIAQAPDGSLWLGTGEGLFHFDGFTFQRINQVNTESPWSLEIRGLLVTANGDLWIGTNYDGIIRLRNGEAKRFPSPGNLPPHTSVTGFAQDADGKIWAGTVFGLLFFDGSDWRVAGKAWGLPEMIFISVKNGSAGTVRASTFSHGIFESVRGEKRFVEWRGVPANIDHPSESPSGETWATTKSGICLVQDSERNLPRPQCTIQRQGNFSPEYPTFDSHGNLWLTFGPGITRLDPAALHLAVRSGRIKDGVESFSKRDGLTSDEVLCIFPDRHDESVWVGTDHGLDHFRGSPFLPALPQPGTHAFAVQPLKDGRVWIGSDHGGLWTSSPEGKTQPADIPADANVPADIESLYATRRGSTLIATGPPVRVESYADGKVHNFPLPASLGQQIAVQSLVEDRRGVIWASFIPYGLASWHDAHWTKNGGVANLPEAWVVVLNIDRDGDTWAGYLNGEVAVIRGTSAIRYGKTNGLNIGAVAAILAERSNGWVAGVNGLAHFDGHSFHSIRDAGNRPLSGITGIAEAANGDLWLNEWDGIRRITVTELQQAQKDPRYAVHSDFYDLPDGLPSAPPRLRPFPTAITATDGRIWLTFRSGVVSINPLDPKLNYPAPPISIIRVIADGKDMKKTGRLELAARTKNLEIEYAAVSLNRASRVRFRYKLEGIDAAFQDSGARRQVFYSNLPPGKYSFRVRASNGDNLWNEAGSRLEITVPPAFTQTVWFLLLCILAALVIIWIIFQLRIRQTIAVVRSHFRERMLERERIAGDLHDTVLQGFVSASTYVHLALDGISEDSPPRRSLVRALELITKANSESRMALQGIRSTQLGDLTLDQAFSCVPLEVSVSSDVAFKVNITGRVRTLRPFVLDEVYRIGREVIVNAFQHSGATRIEVELEYSVTRFRLFVRDNGRGIAPDVLKSGRPGHWGLKGIRERSERIGGNLNLASSPEAGTDVDLTISSQVAFDSEEEPKAKGWVRRLLRIDSDLDLDFHGQNRSDLPPSQSGLNA